MDLCLLECFVTQSLHYLWGFPNPRIVEELPLITPSADPSFSPNPLSSLAICSARVWRNLISPDLFQVLLNRPCSVCLMICVRLRRPESFTIASQASLVPSFSNSHTQEKPPHQVALPRPE